MRYTQQNNGVFAPTGRKKFNYSDGSHIEEAIKESIRHVKDRSTLSPEMLNLCRDWVTYYHFSPQRSHLLRPLEHALKDKLVLELGAGCGALTRFLGETARRVVALEGSERRAEIAALRCADLENVTIINDTIQELELPQRFDVVTLIGVLEYARLYDKESENPELNILQIAKGFLKPGGCLILALENQLGMKYLAGSKEDHVQKHFWGIHDLYNRDSVVTFGRKELESLLFAAGFAKTEQFVPLPDYKLPTTVLHPGSIAEGADRHIDITPFLINSVPHDFQGASSLCFSLEAVAAPLVRNGLVRDLCNSFLFVAFGDEQGALVPSQVLVSHYGTARVKPFAKETLFVLDNGEVRVKRQYLAKDMDRAHASFHNTIQPVETYWKEPLLQQDLVRIMNTPGWSTQTIAHWATSWLQFLESIALIEEKGEKRLPSHTIDLAPFNFFIDKKGEGIPFDMEWSFGEDESVPFLYVALRGLHVALCQLSTVAQPANGVPTNIVELCLQVLGEFGMRARAEDIRYFTTEYSRLLSAAIGWGVRAESILERELLVRVLG